MRKNMSLHKSIKALDFSLIDVTSSIFSTILTTLLTLKRRTKSIYGILNLEIRKLKYKL